MEVPAQGPIVLVVDDNQMTQVLLNKQLRSLGLTCLAAYNGFEAVQALQTYPCHLVLMDIEMPGMNGIDATRAIRTLEAQTKPHPFNTHHLPIIGMGSNAPISQEILTAGFDDFLNKPFPLPQLREKLLHYLSSYQTAAS